MRKFMIVLTALVIVFIAGCKKDEEANNNPVFTGENSVEIVRGATVPNWSTFVLVDDKQDGAIIVTDEMIDLGGFNVNVPGEYKVTYTVEDTDGNSESFVVNVTVTDPFNVGRVVPMVSNPNGVFASLDGFSLTRREVYEEMKKGIGFDMLIQYIEEMIVADYLSNLEQTDIDEAIEKLYYGTNDQELIAKILDDTEYVEALEKNVNTQMLFSGYNPEVPGDVWDYVALQVAKVQFTKEYILNSPSDEVYHVSNVMLKNYYEDTKKGDVCALTVRFGSQNELEAIAEMNNLVLDYNYGIGKYFGTTPINQMSNDSFNETNTTQLTDEEVFAEYITLYNYSNPNNPISESTTMTTFCDDYSELGIYNYDEQYEGVTSEQHPRAVFTEYLYNSLILNDDNGTRYTYITKKIYSDVIMAFKVSEDTVAEFDSLTEAEVAEVKDEFVSQLTSAEVIEAVFNSVIGDKTFSLLDPDFRLLYTFQNSIDMPDVNSETVVAVFDGTDITVDELFDYMTDRYAISVFMSLYETNRLLTSDYFEILYGAETDLSINDSEKISTYRDQLTAFQLGFNEGAYISYNFDPEVLNYDQFLLLAFGTNNVDEIMVNFYIKSELSVYYAFGNLPEYSELVQYMNDTLLDFFRIDVEHLLLYVDNNGDFIPDDYSDFLDGLSELELAEYNALKFEFETLVGDRLTSGYEYSDIVKEYNESLITDVDNEWKDLKAYGFKLRTEVLGTMDYTNIDNYDSDFGEATIELANKLLRPENSDEEYLYGNLVTSDFGVHKIKGIRNDDGVLPTAFYEETDPENPAFTVGNENDSVIPNQTQIDLFNQMKLEEFIGEDKEIYMPDSVFDALLYLYEDVFSQYVSAWGSNLMNLEEVLTGNITFAENSAANVTLIQMQKDTLLDEELIPWIYKD